MEDALLIFIKNPEKGKVKTRIAQTAGPDKALKIYMALLEHTREVCMQVFARKMLFYSDNIVKEDEWPEKEFAKYQQEGPDLGTRMHNAFKTAFRDSSRAVIIGSDCPGIRPELLQQAFQLLETHPMVIGPSEDGGYYLLGLQESSAELFTAIKWSTAEVFSQTMAKAAQLGWSVAILPMLADIDYEADWERHGWPI